MTNSACLKTQVRIALTTDIRMPIHPIDIVGVASSPTGKTSCQASVRDSATENRETDST